MMLLPLQAGYKKNSYPSESQKLKHVTTTHLPHIGDKTVSRKGSFRRTLANKFRKKKTKSASLDEVHDTSPVKPVKWAPTYMYGSYLGVGA